MNTDPRTDQELNRIIEHWRFGEPMYHIRKRGYLYRPDAAGYTDRESEAWRVSLSIAKRHEYLRGEEPVTIHEAKPSNYCTDLNAINQAECQLTETQHAKFRQHLRMLFIRAGFQPGLAYSAAPRSRAEAIVRVIESSKA